MKINGYKDIYGSVDEEEILKFEEEIGFKLPNDYKKFLINYNGGRPEGNYALFTIEGIDQEIIDEMGEATGLEELCGLNIETKFIVKGVEKKFRGLDIRYLKKEYRRDLPNKCIIIGSGLFGIIILSENPEMKGIYLWDNQWRLIPYDEDYDPAEDEEMAFCVYKISDTFTEFLDSLTPYLGD